ncbi:MAG: glycosyltransferase family 4 protein, partial [Anaerolineales bacterium]
AVEELGVPPQQVHIINNGTPDYGRLATRQGDPVSVVFIGAVGERKGVDLLLRALAGLSSDVEWVTRICGDGEVDKYRVMAESHGLTDDKVVFLGWQSAEQIQKVLLEADLFVLPSRAENQPVAIIEAMAVGLPVIASDVGDIPNQVVNGRTGIIVSAGDHHSLRVALQRLINSRDERDTMSKLARQQFLDHYSIEKTVSSVFLLYRSVLSGA